ncbi:DUF1501 domain-containing protein [Leucothrix arctica]|uniref:DUF1501 domain-containing protein n=1 Tax=Leucothrix arctica TaxID=1481894 RepID=A0A317CG06_9GAMM|nr:DUF1501 domain-containing protein [Leucothrix arctica]PWQ97279.1 hypothetical protein DKT75_07000 [Leucothrix arctica]
MKRRDFLKFMLAGTAAGIYAGPAMAAAPKRLIVIFQRGGCDGLNVAVPYGDDEYYNLRPTIAIPKPGNDGGALALDDFFGLHPSMSALHDIYQAGNVAVFPAVHYTGASRSHFDSQQYIESAQISRNADGWLNRHLATQWNDLAMRGVSFGSSVAHSLTGLVPVSSFSKLSQFDLDLDSSAEDKLVNRLTEVYSETSNENINYDSLIRQSGHTLFQDLQATSELSSSESTASYPNNTYGQQLANIATIIKEGAGLELATVSIGGWDTHQNQGGAEGAQANNLKNFSDGIAAFYQDMGSHMQDTMILTMTEFGRTAQENGSFGTDHGHASTWFALGGGVQQGIYGEWPGLQESQLENGRYLAQATDFRDIFSEIVTQHLGNNDESIIPNYAANAIGFL